MGDIYNTNDLMFIKEDIKYLINTTLKFNYLSLNQVVNLS